MRRATGSTIFALVYAIAAASVTFGQALTQPTPPLPHIRKWVHLNGAADLEHLRLTNFNHYLRARTIIAAANEICRPAAAQTHSTRFERDSPSCPAGGWLTSFPPKTVLKFHLEDIGYIAVVAVRIEGRFIDGPLVSGAETGHLVPLRTPVASPLVLTPAPGNASSIDVDH